MAEIERIRFLRPMVGPRVNRRIGDKVFVGEDQPVDPLEARRLVDAGFAEVLRGDVLAAKAEEPEPEPKREPEEPAEDKSEPEIETATVGPEENAAKRTRRPRRKKRSKA